VNFFPMKDQNAKNSVFLRARTTYMFLHSQEFAKITKKTFA
jgi:hypothetical protein